MNFKQIQQLTPKNGERMILIENGEPTAVLVSFDDYQKLANPSMPAMPAMPAVKENTPNPTVEAFQEDAPQEKTDLTLEDLPF